jgi:prepilin-type N-terminal cleavage/methylation domain-containing protein
MQKQQGFSFIELVMVIVIIGIIAGMSTLLLSQGFNAFFSSETLLDANWQGQLAMQRMARDIQLIRSPADISTATASQLSFTDINSNSISYTLSGSNLTLTVNAVTQILATGLSSLTFTYYDKNGVTPPANTAATRYIKITCVVTQNSVNYTLITAAYPRNFAS